MLRSRLVPLAAVAALMAVAGGAALAHAESDHDGMATVQTAKTSLAQAITTAEQQVGGKAFDAGLDNDSGTMAYDIELVNGDKVQKVLVDPQTGKVLKVLPPHAAGDDEENDGEND